MVSYLFGGKVWQLIFFFFFFTYLVMQYGEKTEALGVMVVYMTNKSLTTEQSDLRFEMLQSVPETDTTSDDI